MANEFDPNSIADMVEVKVKLYACRKCGIRYDSMENMEQHHREAHLDSDLDVGSSNIKEEIEDEATEYVIVGQDGLEGIEIGENQQLVQLAQTGENGQLVFQLVDKTPVVGDEEEAGASGAEGASEGAVPAEEETASRKGRSPTKRAPAGGRKRKLTGQTETSPSSATPSRPKRHVVPNIKSEFVYDSITSVTTSAAIANATAAAAKSTATPTSGDEEENAEGGNSSGGVVASTGRSGSRPTYTLVQEGNVITAWQTSPGDEVHEGDKSTDANDQNNNQEEASGEMDSDGEYPMEYTPTSKVKKGRINPPKEDDSALRRFPCPFTGCTYIAKYRSNLWDHKKTHTGEKPYICSWPSCTMRFSQTHQLKLHLRSHTGERPYICTWPGCNSAFSQKPGLKSHMLTHTGEKPFKCDFPGCGWSFRLKGALTDHKRAIHENAKKHVCEWPGCNKRFLQHCHLKKHIMGHADIKPFSCDWPNCNYKAVTMAYVTNHRKTHTGEKNYECTYPNCNKRFVKSSHVNRHRQRCHPDLFMMVTDEGNEEIIHSGLVDDDDDDYEEEDEEQQYTIQEVVHAPPPTRVARARRGQKATAAATAAAQQQQQIVLMKAANQNGDDEDEEESATTIYIQSEDVEEEMVHDGVHQFINGSVVTGELGEQYIISTGESGEVQATPIMIELKKEHHEDDEEEEEHTGEEIVQEEHPDGDEHHEGQSFVINNVEYE